MELSQIFFFVSQAVFLPTFILTTQKLFVKDMKLAGYIKFTLMSPLLIYIYSILLFGIVAVYMPSVNVYKLSAYGDIFALVISLLVSVLYAHETGANNKSAAVFVYNTFYMMGMVFNLIYDGLLSGFLLSVAVPTLVSYMFYKNITMTFVRVETGLVKFQPAMMLLPLIAEVMLVMRILLLIANYLDPKLAPYDEALTVYSTIFGYVILLFLFIACLMISGGLKQVEIISTQKESLLQENKRNEKLSLDMLTALVGTIEAKDKYTNGHSIRVAEYSRKIATNMGLSEKDVDDVYKIALLHDIGKIGIPDEIIMKSGKLTEEEYETIKEHPLTGSEILSGIEEMPELYIGAKYHHERWDGKGYPCGLKGEEIPFKARIISVADAYDAMTSKRSYRDALEIEEVRNELIKGRGTQFFPEAADEMLKIISEESSYTTEA
ncbi:MAG: HD-GYP domain-containing protein [Mogibacterium sp.]|nr:HD-GYP domain-containing protein [Mogibacterium sp.]